MKLSKIEKFKRFVCSRKTQVRANVMLLLYEVFFTLSLLGAIPALGTHFGTGLGDLLFTFITVAVLIFHAVCLLILAVAGAKKTWFAILLVTCFLPIIGLNGLALQGNFKGYSSFGNAHGLYYDRLKNQEEILRLLN